MRQFRTVKSFNEQLHGYRLPKGAVCGRYQGITYYCTNLSTRWRYVHVRIWNDDFKMWEELDNKDNETICKFIASKIRRFHLSNSDIEYPLQYKTADVLPRQKMPQTYSGYQFRAGNMHNRTLTDADAMRPYRFNDEYGIKPTK